MGCQSALAGCSEVILGMAFRVGGGAYIALSRSGADTGPTVVEFTCDLLNRKTAHIQHKGSGELIVSFDSYDEDNNLTQLTDANGQVFTYQYDNLNRQTHQILPAGSDVTQIVTSFDANNNVDIITEHKASGGSDITDHDYDLLDRLTTLTQRGKAISYGYDDNGNRTQVSSAGGSTSYAYDARNRLQTSTSNGQSTTHSWYANGWMQGVTYPNGTEVAYRHDNAGRLASVINRHTADQSVISSFDYAYDDNGNRIEQVEVQNGFSDAQSETTTYRYDTLDRLEGFTITRTDGSQQITDYSYWPSFDRKTEVVTDIATDGTQTVTTNRSYQYDDTHWLQTITDEDDGQQILYTYDNNGNTLTKLDNTKIQPEQTTFAYNSRNQLIETIRGPPTNQTSLGRYQYNYAGMRIRHLGSQRGDIEYLHDGKSVLDEFQNNSTTLVAHYNYADRLISLTTPQNRQFYHYAALGTTANLSTDGGTVQKSYRTDPFGEITKEEGDSVNRNIFTGHEHDTETGLIYMKARFYDPDTGRFLQQDTYLGEAGNPPSLHRYLYAYGNPTVYWDPDGNKSKFGDATKQLENFKDWLSDSNEQADSRVAAVAIGTAQFVTTMGQAVTGGLDIVANLAQSAAGVDDDQVRSELDGTFAAIDRGVDFVVNGDYGQAAKNVYNAAVDETSRAFEGDVGAISNVTQTLLAVATARSATKGGPKAGGAGSSRARLTNEKSAGPVSAPQARPLPYLAYLLGESQVATLLASEGVCPVRVPVAERFALHKLVISQLHSIA